MIEHHRSDRPDDPQPPETTVYGLSPYGRQVYEQIMEALSTEVGHTLTNPEVAAALRRLREETGLDDPPLTDPAIFEHLLRLLRQPPNV